MADTKREKDAVKLLTADHKEVKALFKDYDKLAESGAKAQERETLARQICLMLTVHATTEEEIFYPAMRAIEQGNPILDKSVPEHDDIRRMLGKLRAMQASDAEYDDTVMDLMRTVIHHVADEETVLLPEAERILGKERLSELGVQMTKRRFQLVKPHAGELASSHIRSLSSGSIMVLAGAALALGYMFNRSAHSRDAMQFPRSRHATDHSHHVTHH